MKFKMPIASRKRLEKLLEYLGKTENYSKYYKGNRAEDFKKCFDIESPWCWKYADIVLRGLKQRELGYAEGHHIVPIAWYSQSGKKISRNADKYTVGNWAMLNYGEHTYAHFCLSMCAIGIMVDPMSNAFFGMWWRISKKSRMSPSEKQLLATIRNSDIDNVLKQMGRVRRVEEEGRTHKWEDPVKARRECGRKYASSEAGKKKRAIWKKKNKKKMSEYYKDYRKKNEEKLKQREKEWREKNKVKLALNSKNYQLKNKEKIKDKHKRWSKKNMKHITEYRSKYYIEHREEINMRTKKYAQDHKEEIRIKGKEKRASGEYLEGNRERGRIWRKRHSAEIKRCRVLYNAGKFDEIPPNILKRIQREHAHAKKYWAEKKAAGYKYCTNPVTGKTELVFVGLPVTTKSTEVA